MLLDNRTCLTFTGSRRASLLACAACVLAQPALAEAPSEPVIFLDHAWSQEDRAWYYQFSQQKLVPLTFAFEPCLEERDD